MLPYFRPRNKGEMNSGNTIDGQAVCSGSELPVLVSLSHACHKAVPKYPQRIVKPHKLRTLIEENQSGKL